MKIAGFNFTKINVEKFSNKLENLKVNTKIDISKINEANSNFFKSEEKLLSVNFDYEVSYDPEIAKINLAGNIIFALEPKIAKDILKQWEEKKIPEDFKYNLFNFIMRKSNLKALQLEDEIGLPLHIPLPSLKKQEPSIENNNSEK